MARTASSTGAPWAWALAGALAGVALALTLAAPARWLAAAVESITRGHVLLADARGTVWNGSAQLRLAGGAGSNDAAALPGRVGWTLRPAWGGVRAAVTADCCVTSPLRLAARWRWGGGSLVVDDGASRWPAALLAGLGTPWNTLQLDGELGLSTRSLSVEWINGRFALGGRAELEALRVSSRLSTLRPMGSYRIHLQGGAPPTLRLETIEGSLQLTGEGQWVGPRLRFSGVATAAPDREAALSNLLNIIGRRSGPRSLITFG